MNSDYSIIIVNFNGGRKLHECVESVFRFTSDFELILVDNGSSDNSASSIVHSFPQTKFVPLSKNIGFAKANNLAIEKAQGQWIIFLNPDTKVTRRWIEALVECARRSSDVGVVTPKLLRMDGITIDSTGHTFDFRTGYTSDRGAGELDRGQYDLIEEVPSCCFACAAVRREALDQIGLLDDKMFLYFEDVDYCVRARIGGWKVMYCPSSIVLHARGGATPRSSGRIQHAAVAYRLRIILKCYEKRNAIRYGIVRALRDLKASVAGIKNNDFEYFFGYFRSPFWNLMNLPIKERESIQSMRRVSDGELQSIDKVSRLEYSTNTHSS